MKRLIVALALLLIATLSVPAQAVTNAELAALVQKINTKLKAGEKTEAALQPELKAFADLASAQKKTAPAIAPDTLFMEAMLYLQVLDNEGKATAILNDLVKDYPTSKQAKNAGELLTKLAKRAEARKNQVALKAGQPFPDFAEKDLTGKPLSVGALKGKVVLVDFWATWCGPCVRELPSVIAAHSKYHDQGFEIVGISLDSDRAKLDAFLKKNPGMTWPQYFDGEGWSNKLAQKYGVESIPFTVLIGADGKIIETDLRGAALEKAVAAALAKK